MKIASVANVKARLSEYVRESQHGPVVITRNGKAVAAIVPLADDDEAERLILGYSRKLQVILDAARQRIQAGKGIGHEEFWRQMEEPGKLQHARRANAKGRKGAARLSAA
jgi:prevent-host-death family protein